MLQKIGFQPGINKQVTATAAEGQWIDCDNVRFRYSTPEKIGGWTQLGADNITGAARALHQFTNQVVCSTTYILLNLKQHSQMRLAQKTDQLKLQ